MTDNWPLFILIVVIPFGGMGLFAVHKAVQALWFEHFDKRAAEREAAIAADLTATCGTGLDYGRMVDLVQALPVLEPIEPIKLTRDQWAVIKPQIEVIPTPPWHVPAVNPLFGTPIHIVETVEESTPHLKGWAGYATGGLIPSPADGLPPVIQDEVNRLDGQVWPA